LCHAFGTAMMAKLYVAFGGSKLIALIVRMEYNNEV